MLNIQTYRWKDMKQQKIDAGSGKWVTLQQLNSSSITRGKKEILKSIFELYGFTDVSVTGGNDATGVQFQYQSKKEYGFSVVLQGTKVTAKTPIYKGVVYFKAADSITSYQTVSISNQQITLNSSGTNSSYDFGYVAMCMSENDLYQWDNHKSIFVNEFPVELVDKIDVDKLDKKEDFSKNYNDIYGNVVEKDYLNMIGNIQTIPRYYITNNRSYKIPVFKTNIELYSNNSSHSGQYIFDNEISFKDASSMDVKYWGYSPQVYPIVIFNKTADFDTTVSWKDAGRAWYIKGLNSHSFSKNGSTITIDGMSYTLGSNDCIVAYIRDCGSWSTAGTTAPIWRANNDAAFDWEQDGITSADGGVATLEFSDMKMYLLNNSSYNLTFTLVDSYKSNFTSTPTTNDCFSQIIRTMPETTSTTSLFIKDVADVVDNSYVTRSIGYIYKKDEGNIWSSDYHWYLGKYLNLTTGTWTFKNFQYISPSTISSIDDSASSYWESRSSSVGQDITNNNGIFKSNWDMYCHIDGGINEIGTGAEKPGVIEVNEVLKANHDAYIAGLEPHIWGEATRSLRTWEGTFPAFCPFFKNMKHTANMTPEYGNYPTNFYGSSNGYYYSAQVTYPGQDRSDVTNTLWIKMGYQKTIDDEKTTANTFGLAIVIWRNGKLYL